MTEMIQPPRLEPGMRVGVVAPSSPAEQGRVDAGAAALRALGFDVVFAAHTTAARGYLAGTDADRAADVWAMLARPDVDAVLCQSGGYGAARTLLHLDRAALRGLAARPKPLIGYSDITVLHALVARELGWISFYGPMLTSLAAATPYTVAAFRAALMATAPLTVAAPADGPAVATIAGGRARGRLAGGCLSLVASLIGTPWAWDFRGAIVVLEDLNEAPYRLDRLLVQLRLSGALDGCAGILVGEHVGCDPPADRPSLTLPEVFAELLGPLGVPVLYGLPVGHGRHLATLPLGAMAELDADAGRLHVEPGVR